MKKTLVLNIRSISLAACVWAFACGTVHAQVSVFASVNGPGSILQYTPAGKQSTFFTGLVRPRGMAFDRTGNLYVATNPIATQATILLLTPGGGETTLGAADPNFFIEGLATDSQGNVFAAANDQTDPNLACTIYKFTPAGLRSTFGSIPGEAFGLAFDAAGNLYIGDSIFQFIYKFAPNGTQSVFVGPSAFSSTQSPIGLAFDKSGNLYVSTEDGNGDNLPGDAILKFTLNATESTFASGLLFPRGIAFDNAGNLFVAEVPSDVPGDILKFNSAGKKSVLASSLGGPSGGAEFVVSPHQSGIGPRK